MRGEQQGQELVSVLPDLQQLFGVGRVGPFVTTVVVNALLLLLLVPGREWKQDCAFFLTFALLGGGVFEHPPPCGFFADSKKTAARSAAGFSPTLSPIFLATFVKVSILGHARSGHQVRSSDHTLQKLYNRAPATVFERKVMKLSEYDKVIGTYKTYILDF